MENQKKIEVLREQRKRILDIAEEFPEGNPRREGLLTSIRLLDEAIEEMEEEY